MATLLIVYCVDQLRSATDCSVLKLDSRGRPDGASDDEGKSLCPGKNFHYCMTASPGLVVQWPSFCCGCVTLRENPGGFAIFIRLIYLASVQIDPSGLWAL